ncbi:MAG: ABC transporter permease [Candidatus Thorarchaeota archaeon]
MLRFIVRFFFHNRKRTYQATLTLTLALVIYLATVLLVGGYATNISGMANIIQPSHYLLITENQKSLSESRIDEDVISFLEEYSETTPNVNIILPQLYFPVSVTGETGTQINTHLRLLNFTLFHQYHKPKYTYSFEPPEKNEIIMGQQIVNLLTAGVGAIVEVESPPISINSTLSFQINDNYTVSNMLETGQEFDIEVLGSINEFTLNATLDYVSFIELFILDTREVHTIIEEITAEFDNLEITEEKQTQNFIRYATEEVVTTLTLLEIMFFVLMLVSITYSIYTLVKESEEEIFILRSIGATRGQIILLFMMQALFIGAISAVLSLFIGFFAVSGIVGLVSAFIGLPFLSMNINASTVGIIFLFAISLSVVSGIYPSIVASKIKVIREDHP